MLLIQNIITNITRVLCLLVNLNEFSRTDNTRFFRPPSQEQHCSSRLPSYCSVHALLLI